MFTASTHLCARLSLIIGVLALSLGVVQTACAGPSYVTNLSLYQGFDIDGSMFDRDSRFLMIPFGDPSEVQRVLEPRNFTPEFQPAADLFFSFDPIGAQIVLRPTDPSTAIALLDDTPFEAVDSGWLDHLDPVSGQAAWPLDADDTLVMLTDENIWVKLGDILYDSAAMTISFQYETLAPVPEPASLTLLGLGLCLTLAALRRNMTMTG